MEGMHKEALRLMAERFTEENPANFVPEEKAKRPDLAGMRMYDPPILAVADAEDALFEGLRAPGVIGGHFMPPLEWLPGARSVLSVFLPFTAVVTQSNLEGEGSPSPEWLHARIEGQAALDALMDELRRYCEERGFPSVVPSSDGRFWSQGRPKGTRTWGNEPVPPYTSNWSERHVAYVCGLGTFGLSRHLITEKGMAGRFGSLITTLPLEPNRRSYSRYDEYCNRCGACIDRCPAEAITMDGKDQERCGDFVNATKKRFAPYYGCGKCSVGVPCQSCIPANRP